jgi:general secretion pathway protein D
MEVETPQNVEWSFPQKDFVPVNGAQVQRSESAKEAKASDKNFDGNEKFEVVSQNRGKDAFDGDSANATPSSSPTITEIAHHSPLEPGGLQRSLLEKTAETINTLKQDQSPVTQPMSLQNSSSGNKPSIEIPHSAPDKATENASNTLPNPVTRSGDHVTTPLPEKVPSVDPLSSHSAQDKATENASDPNPYIPNDDAENLSDDDAENLSESLQLSQKRICFLLLKARSLLLMNDFDEAHQIIKVILKSEPNNEKALAIENYIQRCALERNDKFPSNATETREQLIQGIKDTWELPQIVTETTNTQNDDDDWGNVFKHLHQIVIPKISFNRTSLTQAINTVLALSEQYDMEKNQQKSGINMVVMLTNAEAEPTLTLNLKNMPLDKILNFIAKSTAYQFDIEDEVIVFRKAEGILSENLITEFFKISRSAVARMTGIQSTNSDSSGNNSDSKDSKKTDSGGAGNPLAEEERLIKEFLQKAGVNFATIAGSNLAFDGSQLIVTQSLRNIKRVKEILTRYEQVKQVEIETKFIEVQQGKLDELQFGWNSTFQHLGTGTDAAAHPRSFTIGTMNAGNDRSNINNLRSVHDAFTIRNEAGGKGTIAFTNATGAESTVEIPSSTPNAPGGLNLGISATNLANLTGVISDKIGLNLAIRALEQQSGSDLMSAPKLTVLSGKTAKITVAQEFIYPKTYGEISSEVGTGDANSAGVTITAGTPSDFETRNVGVEMNVTPTVEENNCISLQLAPKVTEFEGFIEYGGRSIAISGSTRADLPPGFYQPIFSTREIQTEVTIYDGATVVMGGLTREEIKEVNDKVPLLGDIPLIGKLFRSKGETNQKKNLLIFVTANILSPGGTPIRMQNKTHKKELVYRSPKEGHWNVFTEIK